MESAIKCVWNIAGNCQKPVDLVVFARPTKEDNSQYVVVSPGKPKSLELTYRIKCSRCIICTAERRRMWGLRAYHETSRAIDRGSRTWLATFTCSPDYLYKVQCAAVAALARKGKTFEGLSSTQQFRVKEAQVYRDIQRYLKRLRKGSPEKHLEAGRFTFLCVSEAHQSGEPHFHMLIHEADPSSPIRQRVLKGAVWPGGFSDFRLLENDPRLAGYACKYLSKSEGRVRASIRYGLRPVDRAPVKEAPEGATPPAAKGREQTSV